MPGSRVKPGMTEEEDRDDALGGGGRDDTRCGAGDDALWRRDGALGDGMVHWAAADDAPGAGMVRWAAANDALGGTGWPARGWKGAAW